MNSLPQTEVPLGAQIYVRYGDGEAVSYMPGHAHAEMEFTVAGQRTACTAVEAQELAEALTQALTDPMAATILVAQRVAALGNGGRR